MYRIKTKQGHKSENISWNVVNDHLRQMGKLTTSKRMDGNLPNYYKTIQGIEHCTDCLTNLSGRIANKTMVLETKKHPSSFLKLLYMIHSPWPQQLNTGHLLNIGNCLIDWSTECPTISLLLHKISFFWLSHYDFPDYRQLT
jgi:hypothetical protein